MAAAGKTTTAAPPFGAAGTVAYGANVNAAAILLGIEGNVPLERTALLMATLLAAPVWTGFVARALARFAQRLAAAGFDEAMTTALRAEDVLCADETPTNVLRKDTDELGEPVAGSPHAVTVRTPDARLVWYAPIGSRSKTALSGLGVLEGYTGYLVRDDYVGWHQFDAQLAGVQQCIAHLIRHAKGVLQLHPTQQQWAGEVITVLCQTAAAVSAAQTASHDQLDPQLLADLRQRYDDAVSWGIATNRHRDWARGNHPGYNLATRLRDKIEQVWLFTQNLAVPWTNNASEQALKGPKRHPGRLRLLAHPHHPRRILPRPLLPGQRPRPPHPCHRRHPQHPHRQPLAPHTRYGLTAQLTREWTPNEALRWVHWLGWFTPHTEQGTDGLGLPWGSVAADQDDSRSAVTWDVGA